MRFSLSTLATVPRKYLVIAGVIVLLALYFFFGRGSSMGATLTVHSGDFATHVSVSGTVVAAQDVTLGFAANGRIAGTYAKVGDRVQAGAMLAEIENGDLRALLEQAQANLASLLSGSRPEEVAIARATLASALQAAYTTADDSVHNKADTLFNTADTLLTNPPADLKVNFNALDDTQKHLVERERAALNTLFAHWALLPSQVTPDTLIQAAQQTQSYLDQVATFLADTNALVSKGVTDQKTTATTLASYASTVATARANVNTASAALASAAKSLILTQAQATPDTVLAQRAIVQNAAAALEKTRVVAPFAGVVTRMDAKVGEIVSPSATLISMQSGGVFQIETYVSEVTIAGVAVGNTATTTLDAYGSVAFPSVVVAVDPAETERNGVPAYKTTLAFATEDARIRSGMTANVVITTGMLHDAIVVPSGAIGTKDGQSFVTLVIAGKSENRTVQTGISPALGQTQIVSGLSSGDTILLTPLP